MRMFDSLSSKDEFKDQKVKWYSERVTRYQMRKKKIKMNFNQNFDASLPDDDNDEIDEKN